MMDMSRDKELYERARQEMRLSEKILAEIPGFRGYKEKELRRESDRLIRDHTYKRLLGARDDLKEIFQRLSDHRLHEALTEMDRLVMSLDRVTEKINHASYGYTGFFNVLKVKEEKLDKMISFDAGLIDHAERICQEVNIFKDEIGKASFDKTLDHIKNIRVSLDALEDLFDSRREIILEG